MNEHDRFGRFIVIALCVVYLLAGGVVGFACMTLLNVSDQIHATPLCQRIR
jgi:hypothetical protein